MKAKRYGNGSVAITGGKKREEYTEPMDEEEEATRAPYWHVSWQDMWLLDWKRARPLTLLAVYGSWWYWRDIG